MVLGFNWVADRIWLVWEEGRESGCAGVGALLASSDLDGRCM